MIDTVKRVIAEYDTHDPEKILKMMGVKIFIFPMEGINGIFREIKGIPMVFINSNLPDEEIAFVMAHELGHVLLHKDVNRLFLDRHTYLQSNYYETEANLFAVCLLNPDSQDVIDEGDTFEKLACKMGVSVDLARLYFEDTNKTTGKKDE